MAIQVTLQILILFTFLSRLGTVADHGLSSQDVVSPQECWNFCTCSCFLIISNSLIRDCLSNEFFSRSNYPTNHATVHALFCNSFPRSLRAIKAIFIKHFR